MKIMFTLLISSTIVHANAYQGTTVSEVWEQIESDNYIEIPTKEVTASKIYKKIFTRAKKTVNDQSDISPQFNKLLHANGICMLGRWSINKNNPYSGYFKINSNAMVIARASTTLSGVKRGEKRGFGMALKLYPTDFYADPVRYKTAQIFTIDTLAGNMVSHYMKSKMSNMPKFGFTLDAALGLIVGNAFILADQFPMIRQVYQVSELGEENEVIKTPRYFMLQGDQNMALSNEADFRTELTNAMEINKGLKFNIYVGSKKNNLKSIGSILFSEISASESCDTRLHFHHPKFRYDLNH